MKRVKSIKGAEFNENFKIVVKKDCEKYKAGEELGLQETAIIVDNAKLPGVLNKQQIQEARILYNKVHSYRKVAKKFKVCQMTIWRALNP